MFIPRESITYLNNWKNDSSRKSLILDGARQVGKSSLVKEFGASFKEFLEINFEKQPQYSKLFEGNLEPKNILQQLRAISGKDLVPSNTLLFLDEIQECPRALTSLRYFYEELPQLHVIGAGSLLQLAIEKVGVPVGRVSYLYLYPLSFYEFLDALGHDNLKDFIKTAKIDTEISPTIHDLILDFVKKYILIGGMPEVVSQYIQSGDLRKVSEIQSDIISTFRNDFRKYSKERLVPYVEMVFKGTPKILGEKFKYSKIDKEIRSVYLKEALSLLVEAKIIHKAHHSSANGLPLGAQVNYDLFKAYFLDIGLANSLSGVDLKTWVQISPSDLVSKGGLAEQFVAQELIVNSDCRRRAELYFWQRESKSSSAEVDFLITKDSRIIPLEVKYGSSGKMKSLLKFMEEKSPPAAFKLSSENSSFSRGIRTLPIYFAGRICSG